SLRQTPRRLLTQERGNRLGCPEGWRGIRQRSHPVCVLTATVVLWRGPRGGALQERYIRARRVSGGFGSITGPRLRSHGQEPTDDAFGSSERQPLRLKCRAKNANDDAVVVDRHSREWPRRVDQGRPQSPREDVSGHL